MDNKFELINRKVICERTGLSRFLLNVELEALMNDPSLSFGKIRGRKFTPKQIEIFERETGYKILKNDSKRND
jgi:tRNA 2-selenouridine synthase SelU